MRQEDLAVLTLGAAFQRGAQIVGLWRLQDTAEDRQQRIFSIIPGYSRIVEGERERVQGP